MKKIELLAPAGNFSKLKTAIYFDDPSLTDKLYDVAVDNAFRPVSIYYDSIYEINKGLSSKNKTFEVGFSNKVRKASVLLHFAFCILHFYLFTFIKYPGR